MPTRNRRQWAEEAVECVRAQTYAAKNLVVLDDEDEPSFPQFSASWDGEFVGIQWIYRREPRRNIIDKRNRVNSLATGDLIAHFDSDDWSDPARLEQQVALLLSSNKAVTGYHTMLFYEPSTGGVARYLNDPHYACGTSLLYRRDFWARHRFRKPKLTEYGSDNIFVRDAKDNKELISVASGQMMVARLHSENTSPNRLYRMNQQLKLEDLPEGFPR